MFAYLFGSVAEGKNNKLSDIDIDVFINEIFDLENVRLELVIKLLDLLKTFDVDVVVLNTPPLLVHSLIRTGKLLVSKNEEDRLSFRKI